MISDVCLMIWNIKKRSVVAEDVLEEVAVLEDGLFVVVEVVEHSHAADVHHLGLLAPLPPLHPLQADVGRPHGLGTHE